MRKTHTTQKGFTLLFSVLVTTLVVSISATIISIAIRQTILSSTSRESQYAFYAANTGIECAFFWDNYSADDVTGFVFPASVNGSLETEINLDASAITCIGQSLDISLPPAENTTNTSTHTFEFDISPVAPVGLSVSRCASVEIQKTFDASDGTVQTYIQSRGWNTSCDDRANNPRAVERGIELRYES